jgi:hypothetical protein
MSILLEINIRTRGPMSIEKQVEFPEFLENTVVHERNLLEKGHLEAGRYPGSLQGTLKNFG